MRLANRWQKRLDPRASTYSSSLLVGCQHREWLIWCRTKAVLADQPLGRVATPRRGRAGRHVLHARRAGKYDWRNSGRERRLLFTDLEATEKVDRPPGAKALLASRPRWFDRLVVGIVTAAGARTRHDPQLLVLGVFHLEVRRFEFAKEPRSAFDGDATGLLYPLPHGVAAVIVNDIPGGAGSGCLSARLGGRLRHCATGRTSLGLGVA